MVDRAKEQLLGYLLGALEESERESIENQLEQNPKLLSDLGLVRESLQPLWVAQPDFAAPPGLATRTCEFVSGHPPCEVPLPANPMIEAEPAGSRGNYANWLDVAVAVGIVAAASLLIFPAIQNSRSNSRLAGCKDHLRQIGLALTQYSETYEDYFPPVYDEGRFAGAGIVAPLLVTNGYVDGSQWFVCPASPLAENREFRVPSLDDLLTASQEELVSMRSTMSGSFGYTLGFVEHGRYHNTRNLRRPDFALMSDAPSAFLSGYQSVNHDGRGQNVLFEGGRVLFLPTSRPHARADDVFVNESGMVDAGKHRDDSVIGPSASVPHLLHGASFIRTGL
jgi:hypothetical protein